MEKKYLNIEIPKGFEIDKENSTFEKIVFKPIDKTIEYVQYYDEISRKIHKGIKINYEGESFLIKELDYSFAMSWCDAINCAKDHHFTLPSRKQCEIIYKYRDKINSLLEKSKLEYAFYWTSEEYSVSDAWVVYFYSGHVNHFTKSNVGRVLFITNLK